MLDFYGAPQNPLTQLSTFSISYCKIRLKYVKHDWCTTLVCGTRRTTWFHQQRTGHSSSPPICSSHQTKHRCSGHVILNSRMRIRDIILQHYHNCEYHIKPSTSKWYNISSASQKINYNFNNNCKNNMYICHVLVNLTFVEKSRINLEMKVFYHSNFSKNFLKSAIWARDELRKGGIGCT